MMRTIRGGLAIVIAAVLCVVSRDAGEQAAPPAQPIEFAVQNFKPAVSTRGFWVTENGNTLEHLSPSAHLLLNYAKRPLQVVDADTDENEADIIEARWNVDLLLAMGFIDRLELGVAIPATLAQSGEDLQTLDRPAGDSLSGAFGDIRIIPKVRLGNHRQRRDVLRPGAAVLGPLRQPGEPAR